MNRYPHPDIKDLPEDIRAKVLEVQEKAGFVPNVFLALARRPAEWRAFFAYHDALMLKDDSGLSKGDREMIVTTTSAANQCLYCVVAHGAILRIYERKPLVADQVAVNYRKADITPRQPQEYVGDEAGFLLDFQHFGLDVGGQVQNAGGWVTRGGSHGGGATMVRLGK